VIQLSELSAKLLESPEAIETKISIIKDAIHSGQYQINPECIAMHLMTLSSTRPSLEIA
jgi:anti-sigma28 factor (negative regulator of flagellin synthesis)